MHQCALRHHRMISRLRYNFDRLTYTSVCLCVCKPLVFDFCSQSKICHDSPDITIWFALNKTILWEKRKDREREKWLEYTMNQDKTDTRLNDYQCISCRSYMYVTKTARWSNVTSSVCVISHRNTHDCTQVTVYNTQLGSTVLNVFNPHRTHTHSLSLSVDNSEQAALHRT